MGEVDRSETERGPSTLTELKSIRKQYVILFIVLHVGIFVCGMVTYAVSASEQTASETYMGLVGIAKVVLIIITGINGRLIGLERPWLLAVATLLPFMNWVAFFRILRYKPEHLKDITQKAKEE